MTEFLSSPTFASTAALEAHVSAARGFAALGSFTVSGLTVTRGLDDALFRVGKYVGERRVPQDIKSLRRSTSEMMRRLGQPVIIKHMWSPADEEKGLARKSDNFQDAYGQVRNRDPLSFGTGYCSIQNATDEWIAPGGSIVTNSVSPGLDFVPAPEYRGYGPGYLTYLIEPDAAVDVYLHDPLGAFIRVQQAQAVAAWFPEINDNDLIINVELDREGRVVNTSERYVAKQTNPVSIRGLDRRGQTEYSGDRGNSHMINQRFEMSLLPVGHTLYDMDIDR